MHLLNCETVIIIVKNKQVFFRVEQSKLVTILVGKLEAIKKYEKTMEIEGIKKSSVFSRNKLFKKKILLGN